MAGAGGRARRTLAPVWTVLVALVALFAGLTAGLLLAGRRIRSRIAGSAPQEPAPGGLSPDAIDILASLRSVTVVVDSSDRVVRSCSRAVALGLVRGTELAHEQLRLLTREVRRDEQLREVELELSRSQLGHGRLDVGVRVAPLGADYVLLLIDDQTQSRRVEETRRDFVVNVSHELKTPVAGLTLLAEAVEDARDDPEAITRFTGRMKSETQRLSRLVQEIVQLSRLQVADTLDEPVLVDVRGCVREAIDHMSLLAADRRITLTTSLGDPDVPATIYGDATLITTGVRNLVENAVNYSDPGTRVSIALLPGRDLVQVIVKDQGSGIPAAELDRIFERFYRVDAARSRRTGGTGLGLAIVKHISLNHGGEVSVWSEEGQGSTFTIKLPAAAEALDPRSEPLLTREVTR